jgi:hypothetical protein
MSWKVSELLLLLSCASHFLLKIYQKMQLDDFAKATESACQNRSFADAGICLCVTSHPDKVASGRAWA